MAVTLISNLPAANPANLTGARIAADDNAGATVYITPAQLKTELSGGSQSFGAVAATTVTASTSVTTPVSNVGAAAGAASSASTKVITKTGIADATQTPCATVTVPNAGHAATMRVTVLAWLGAGGAIGEFEASAQAVFQIKVNRTAGLATVQRFSTILAPVGDSVAGGATITLAGAISGLTGANSVEQTFTIDVTITKGSGSSTNHKAILTIELVNAAASGVTVA